MAILDLHQIAASLQDHLSADEPSIPSSLLAKALLQAINEIDLLNDRINRLEANTVITSNKAAQVVDSESDSR